MKISIFLSALFCILLLQIPAFSSKVFSELDMGKDIQYGENIDALSGATFSASSITREINRINKLILEIDK